MLASAAARAAGPCDRRGVRRLRRRHVEARRRALGRSVHAHQPTARHAVRNTDRHGPLTRRCRRIAGIGRPRAGARSGVARRPWRRSLRALGAGLCPRVRRARASRRVRGTGAPMPGASRERGAALAGSLPHAGRRSSSTHPPHPPDRPVPVVAPTSLAGTRRRACPSIDGARSRSRRFRREAMSPPQPAGGACRRACVDVRAARRRRGGAGCRRGGGCSPPSSTASPSPARARRRCLRTSRRPSRA